MDGQRQCEHIKADGSRCKAAVLPGKSLCVFHAPDLKARREEGRRRGGREGGRKTVVLPLGTPDVRPRSPADVVDLLGETISQTRRGEIDPKIANALGYLSSVMLRALQDGDLETRLEAIEAQLGGKK